MDEARSSESDEDGECRATVNAGKRGPTFFTKLSKQQSSSKKKKIVEFNAEGNPIGYTSTKWRTFLGFVARSRVPITYPEWKKVPNELKDLMWSDMKAKYDVSDRYKQQEIRNAGVSWRNFKSYLTREYAKKDLDPTEKYKYVTPDQWSTFLTNRDDPKFVEGSKAASVRAKKNKYHYTYVVVVTGRLRQVEGGEVRTFAAIWSF